MGFRIKVQSIKPELNLHSLEIYLVFMCKSVVKQKVKCTYHADCRAPISNDLWTLNIQIRFGFFFADCLQCTWGSRIHFFVRIEQQMIHNTESQLCYNRAKAFQKSEVAFQFNYRFQFY